MTVSTGILTTIAGTGTDSYSGDTGQATSAALNYPFGVSLDSSGITVMHRIIFRFYILLTTELFIGNVYIADAYNNRIRKITVSTGIITTIAGDGTYGYSRDNGQATSAALSRPSGVSLDTSGSIIHASHHPQIS